MRKCIVISLMVFFSSSAMAANVAVTSHKVSKNAGLLVQMNIDPNTKKEVASGVYTFNARATDPWRPNMNEFYEDRRFSVLVNCNSALWKVLEPVNTIDSLGNVKKQGREIDYGWEDYYLGAKAKGVLCK